MSLFEKYYKARYEKSSIQRRISRLLFSGLESVGFHLTADHFYDNIPNSKLVEETYSHQPRPCTGLDFSYKDAEQFVSNGLEKYSKEINSDAIFEFGYVETNSYFKGLDSLTFYVFLREHKPNTIVEIGQGMSTRIVAAATKRNWQDTGKRTRVISIDPYTRAVLGDEVNEWMDFEVVKSPLQDVDRSVFGRLRSGDLLFVDSSHVFKYGSDVENEFDHVYPSLAPGVLIHVHDIFTPYDYPKHWMVKRKQFWNEQYVLENFLRYNNCFRVLLPLHMILRQSESVKSLLDNEFGGRYRSEASSFYIERFH